LETERQISLIVRRPSTRKKTCHSSGVSVTLCLTRSGFAIASTAMFRSGKNSSSRSRSSMRRTPSIRRFCRSISSVTTAVGGGTRSKNVNVPCPHVKVSKMTSDTWTFRKDASSSSLTIFSDSRSSPSFWIPPACRARMRSRSGSLSRPIRTSMEPRRRSPRVATANTGRPVRTNSFDSSSERSSTSTPVRCPMLRKDRMSGTANPPRSPSRIFCMGRS
jgi:hypothetical protein